MVKIRLKRVGKRKQPSYRVVVADSRSPRDGRIIEAIGHYQPRAEPSGVAIDNERALYWLRQGAQPSDSVRNLLEISGAWTDFTGTPSTKTAPGVAAPKKKATPAASVTAAESVSEDDTEVQEGAEKPAATPEAVDQEPAAPDAPPEK